MIDGQKVLALIPARGGSKRLPRKNVMKLAGKPLIAWSIEAAKHSAYIDEVVVSTDDAEIQKISMSYGANVPFQRPEELATDTASSNDVVMHAINTMSDLGRHFDRIVILQHTSPLREAKDIDAALELMEAKHAKGVVSVCECEHSPLWANTLSENKQLGSFIREDVKNKRSQDLPLYYRLNGSIYILEVNSVLANKGIFYDDTVFAYEMSPEYSVDIDAKLDFIVAEALMNLKRNIQ